jgi:hypothetical protein
LNPPFPLEEVHDNNVLGGPTPETVAMHITSEPARIEDGEQFTFTDVLVVGCPTVSWKVPLLVK